ncbi:MAG: cation diffusion facilitator family transporter [bacterium]|nr:cation diffusion facilitator family transporter [bacterium]
MNKQTKYMTISMIANVFLCIIKILFGVISNTKSLIADGIHSFSDLSTDIIAIIGCKLSNKPADDNHPKGHGKIEYITGLIISIFIMGVGISLIKNSIDKDNTIPNFYLSIVIIITIITKTFVSRLLIKKGKKLNSMILICSGKESYTDVYSSILVLIVVIISQFYKRIGILKYSDMIGSIIISILILIIGFKLFRDNLSLLIGEREQNEDIISNIERVIKDRNYDFSYKDLTVFKLGTYYDVTFKILVDGECSVREGHMLMDDIEKDLLNSKMNINYITIHIEPK